MRHAARNEYGRQHRKNGLLINPNYRRAIDLHLKSLEEHEVHEIPAALHEGVHPGD